MEEGIRIKSALRVRIGEAKSLPSKSCRILPGCPNTFCMITLDKEKLFDTETVYGTPCPFFSEQFEFEIPRAFWTIGFYLVATDTTFSITKQSTIGKVTFTKEQLSTVPNKDQWHGLKSVKCNSEAQGKANIAMCMVTEGSNIILQVRLKECANLYISDLQKVQPYAVLEIVGPNNSVRGRAQETRTLRRNMQWKTQTFEFKLNDILRKCAHDQGKLSLKVDFYHYKGLLKEGTFLGEVIASLAHVSHTWSDKWYFLCPKRNEITLQPNHDLGSLRLRIEYQEDIILPGRCYQPLLDLLTSALDAPEEVESSALVVMTSVFNDQLINIAQSVIRIFLHLGRVEELLLALTDLDMHKTSNPNTLFRANSLATKGVDELMKLIGRPYLRDVLKPSLDKIHKENQMCEIDPARLRSSDSLSCNLDNLTRNIDSVYAAIIGSGHACPLTLSSLFSKLQCQAEKHFPDTKDIRYTAVSGFVFLRLFAPAILNPKLFKLQAKRPAHQTSRTLTLVSKVIQSLGNLDTHQAGKEQYMAAISKRVLDQAHVNGVKQFLEDICKTENKKEEDYACPVREGKLVEYRVSGILGREYSKRRKLYRLTETDLSCLRYDDMSTIPTECIRGAERVDEGAFGASHIFQVIHNTGTLYLRASNSVDHFEWLSSVKRSICAGKDKLTRYHSGAMVYNKWTCCGSKNPAHEAEGCHPTTTHRLPDIDIFREMERLYQILHNGLEKLESHSEYLAKSEREIDKRSLASLHKLIPIVQELTAAHDDFKSSDTAIAPGSRHMPLAPALTG